MTLIPHTRYEGAFHVKLWLLSYIAYCLPCSSFSPILSVAPVAVPLSCWELSTLSPCVRYPAPFIAIGTKHKRLKNQDGRNPNPYNHTRG